MARTITCDVCGVCGEEKRCYELAKVRIDYPKTFGTEYASSPQGIARQDKGLEPYNDEDCFTCDVCGECLAEMKVLRHIQTDKEKAMATS